MKDALEKIDSEIRKEKAEALGRAGERLERAIRDLEMAGRELMQIWASIPSCQQQEAHLEAGMQEKWDQYFRLARHVQILRHHLIIQREAVGLRRHEDVDWQYPLPPALDLTRPKRSGGLP